MPLWRGMVFAKGEFRALYSVQCACRVLLSMCAWSQGVLGGFSVTSLYCHSFPFTACHCVKVNHPQAVLSSMDSLAHGAQSTAIIMPTDGTVVADMAG